MVSFSQLTSQGSHAQIEVRVRVYVPVTQLPPLSNPSSQLTKCRILNLGLYIHICLYAAGGNEVWKVICRVEDEDAVHSTAHQPHSTTHTALTATSSEDTHTLL